MANVIAQANKKHLEIRHSLTVSREISLGKARDAAIAAAELYEWLVNEAAIDVRKAAKRKGKQ